MEQTAEEYAYSVEGVRWREYHVKDTLVPVSRGKERVPGSGFEPAFNEFYDSHASDKVSSKPVLCLEDVALCLPLRKCADVEQDDWEAPSVRHLKRKLRTGADMPYETLAPLTRAHLLWKVSGLRRSGNTLNQYGLFDPLADEEFMEAARAGALHAS